jgi:hypothetical protein
MNNYIKNPFIQKYSKTLNEETNKMLHFVEENRELAKADLNKIFTLKPDDILSEIENKLNNTLKAVEAYNLHFNNFNIPDIVKKFLEQYISNTISPKYEEINNILNTATKDLIMNNLETNSENFKNSFNSDEFESKNKEIIDNLTISFNKINESLKSYGAIESEYSEKLEKEIVKYNRIRILDELDDDKIAYSRRIADVKLDETFQEIKNSSENIKQFIESLNLFKEFEEKINKYINDINYQYGISQNTIKKNKDYYDELNDKLYELNSYSLGYYKKVNSSYHKTKELILESIEKINELIENCTNITFKIITDKYIEYKDNFNAIYVPNKREEDEQNFDDYNERIDDKIYIVKAKIKSYKIENEIQMDIKFEDEEMKKPKIEGSLINKNRPTMFEIDIYSKYGQKCGKIGRKISAEINNISLSVDLNIDGGLNSGSFITKTDFDEYIIKNYFYETKEIKQSRIIGNIEFPLPSRCDEIKVDIPEGEKEEEIISAKKNETNIQYNFLN